MVEIWKDLSGGYYNVRLYGTNAENLLTWASAHICPAECGQESVGPRLLHCAKHRGLRSLEEIRDLPWRDVLLSAGRQEEDELAGLRGRVDKIATPAVADPGAGEKDEKEAQKEPEKEKKKKKKEKKKKKRARSSSSSASSSTSSGVRHKAVQQKVMFGGSGLDPLKKARRWQRRKAQRYAQRSHGRGGDSKSDSSNEGIFLKGQAIFGEPQRVRAVAMNFPGVLSAQTIENMQELMLAEAGQESAQQDSWVPTFLKYYRQMLSRRVSGPMNRELHTLRTVGDLVLRGQLPEAMDTLTQRVKSLEAQIGLPSDTATLSSRQELKIATTEQKAEAQAHQSGAWWSKGAGKESGKSEKTDKGKGKGKKGKEKPRKE